ncbi:MAG: DUF1826 domain-containing protein [Proteobacteria bacterium]|nr:DUF1826 domain-containing protein [Pseudomonadota bacterium]
MSVAPASPPLPQLHGLSRRGRATPDGHQAPDGYIRAVVACLSPTALLAVREPTVGMAFWRRPGRAGLRPAIESALALPPFGEVAEGVPDEAAHALLRRMPAMMRPLRAELAMLGRLFATLSGDPVVRLRLEHVTDDACRQFHIDSVELRLLCTYAGVGTEWIAADGTSRRLSVGDVAVLKGSKFPDTAPRILHRSPPVEHLPRWRRSRLLLCIDQPGVF